MALKMGEGGESYAPLATAILGGLSVSLLLTVFVVPAAYLLVEGRSGSSGRSTECENKPVSV
jgi:multidrug efflux pump subunit AcrB